MQDIDIEKVFKTSGLIILIEVIIVIIKLII